MRALVIAIAAALLMITGSLSRAGAQGLVQGQVQGQVQVQGQQPGRYQLVLEPDGPTWLVDTVTGRMWRQTRLTGPGGTPQPGSPCKGVGTCFFEVDRMRLTDSGWESEIVPKP